MDWAEKILSKEQTATVERAIAEVELKTAAELVVVVAKASSYYSHTHVILFLILSVLQIPLLVLNRIDIGNMWVEAGWMLGYFLVQWGVAKWLSHFDCWKRWLTSKRDRSLAVHRRAECEFYENKIHHTMGRTGVLIFISKLERRVVILADELISQKCPPDLWGEMVEAMLHAIPNGLLGESIATHLTKLSEKLEMHFPPTKQNPNELSDSVVFKN